MNWAAVAGSKRSKRSTRFEEWKLTKVQSLPTLDVDDDATNAASDLHLLNEQIHKSLALPLDKTYMVYKTISADPPGKDTVRIAAKDARQISLTIRTFLNRPYRMTWVNC